MNEGQGVQEVSKETQPTYFCSDTEKKKDIDL